MVGPWRHGEPACEANERIECWNRIGDDNWFQFIGRTSNHDGEVIILVADMEHQEFHTSPPCPTEAKQVWRSL